ERQSRHSTRGRFNLDGYLTPHSDLVSLMVFEHQMHMMNLLTRIGWEARVAGFRRGKTPERPLDAAAREVAGYMLFTGEAPLSGPIHGSTTFADEFEARGPRDAKGRSLRDFDLTTRMFRYPLSYMIYSPQFDALPAAARDAIYKELWRGLSGRNRAERTAIVEILRDTRSGLPSYFTPAR